VEFHEAIRAAIPTLMTSLADPALYVRMGAISTLDELAEHGEPYQNLVEPRLTRI
jgi:hypothetical protein